MEENEVERKSNELGLRKLAENYKADLRKALENGVALAGKIPPDLHWTDEPSHTFNLPQRSEVKDD
jgi:hypothetical protein